MNNNEMHRMRRRETLLKLAATGALAAGGLANLMRGARAAGSLPATPGMRHIRGQVAIDAQRATIGAPVRPGQSVETGPASEAIYILGSDAFMQRDNSKVRFTDDKGVHVIHVAAGKLLAALNRSQRQLQLLTPTATIALRGGACYIEAQETRTYFCLCYGEAEVTPAADPAARQLLRTEHHDKPLYIHAKSSGPVFAPATFLDHTDAELTLLENSVGRWPPFQQNNTR